MKEGSTTDRRVWTQEEDDAIRKLVAKFGTKSWSLIAENIVKDFSLDEKHQLFWKTALEVYNLDKTELKKSCS